MTTAVEIDGSHGEGGGQILRTSLALAMLTGRPLEMSRIRAGRAKPGLRRQHLACVEAAARLCHAEVHGARVGSQELAFRPGAITGGVLDIDIGSAGSTTLVVQTILVPAIAAGVALRAVIRGGTHNPLAPPFEFLDRAWLPHLRAMGARVELTLDRHGFAPGGEPAGGGRATAPGQLTLMLEPGGSEEMLKPGGEIEYTQDAVNLVDLLGRFIFSGASGSGPTGAPAPAGGQPGGAQGATPPASGSGSSPSSSPPASATEQQSAPTLLQ